MARGELRFSADEIDKWADAFEELSKGPTREMREEWSVANEEAFRRSQQIVHVDTGFLKASGTRSVSLSKTALESEVNYEASRAMLDAEQARRDARAHANAARRGRVFTPKPGRKPLRNYGEYEHRRGGSHAFLVRAFAESSGAFERGLARGFERLFKRWK